MLKKLIPAITGAIGFAVGGPIGASIGAGLGSAFRGDNPANIATSALMGFGLGSLGASAGLVGGKGLSALGTSAKELVAPSLGMSPGESMARYGNISKAGTTPSVFQRGAEAFGGMSTLAKGALGLGAIGALSSMDEEESASIEPPPEVGSQGMLDISTPGVTYYDKTTGEYGAASPTYPTYRSLAEGGDVIDTESRSLDDVINNFPRKVGQIDGPGTEKSDDIPAMLSDGEFVMTAAAVRGLGALNGADKDDKLEQRRKGAKMMYDMMDKFESKVA
jgi:hypothetical protein